MGKDIIYIYKQGPKKQHSEVHKTYTIFFFIDREVYILKRGAKRTTQGIEEICIHGQKAQTREGSTKQERIGIQQHHLEQEPNQSKELTKVEEPSSINILVFN